MASVDYSLDGEVAVLAVDHPPVNALSAATRQAIGDALERAGNDEAASAVVILGAGRTFIAGADISEFGTPKTFEKPSLHDLIATLEDFPKLTIAAIHGTALGGGLELALGCDARVAVASAKVGLPEVALGLLPGAGGTQRLPRLTGIEPALGIITSGKHVPAQKAAELGILDEVVDDLRGGAVDFARKALSEGTAFQPVLKRNDKLIADAQLFDTFRAKTAKKARGKIAPMAIIDCIKKAAEGDAQAGLAYERKRFLELLESDQAKALQYYFFAERQARKIPGLSDAAQAKNIASAAVIGAGTMGGGIAMVFANAGIPVRLLDVADETLDKGMATIRKNYETSVARGSIPQSRMDGALSLIRPTTDYEALRDADIVIEAVFEDMELKQKIFRRLDEVMKPGAVLATNTSSLDIDAIAAATHRPEDVIGVHFFSPANVMRLQENVRGAKSSDATIKTVMELGKRLGKVVVLAGNCDGFIGNRMLQFYTGEAEFLLEQGATPEQVDNAAMAFGMPMGPIAMRDLSGLDVGMFIRKQRAASLPDDERFSPITERLYEAGRLGQKSGKGFYRYEGRERIADPEVQAVIEDVSRELGIERRAFDEAEIQLRLFAPLVVEGAKELEDGTALRASDIDVVWVNGYGFPAHRGGPMYWAEQVGLNRIVQAARDAAQRNGRRWAPSPLLERLAAEGKGWKDA